MEKAGKNSFTLIQETVVHLKKKKKKRRFAQKTFDHRTLLLDLWITVHNKMRSEKISSL